MPPLSEYHNHIQSVRNLPCPKVHFLNAEKGFFCFKLTLVVLRFYTNLTPMTCGIADADKNQLDFAFCFLEGFFSPRELI